MKICGIIAEYNPFHSGHLYQIGQIRRILGKDTAIVCCMSGDFVQRGEAALLNKTLRAEMAVSCGADLVLSLPLRWSLSSAQGFADGAVHILGLAGAGYIAFGAEDADLEVLGQLAVLISEREVTAGTIRNMEGGLPFARARERELYNRIKEKANIIAKPNNLLAVEYLRAVRQQGFDIEPLAIPRLGAGHDGGAEGDIASASHIRSLIRYGRLDEAGRYMPAEAYKILTEAQGQGFVMADLARLDCAMTAVLSRMGAENMARLPDAAEGLENRLARAVHEGRSFGQICDMAKTKRYAYSRIRRMLYCAFLGIEKGGPALPPFTRVLAFNDRGRRVLAGIPEHDEGFAVITKPAMAKAMLPEALAEFQLEASASAAYDLALPGYAGLDRSREWKKGPVYIKSLQPCQGRGQREADSGGEI